MQTTEQPVGTTATIEADLAGLHRLAADLRRLAGEFGAGSSPAGLAEPQLAAAIGDAEHDWRGHRSRLAEFLSATSTAVAGAAQAYQQADGAVAAAARPS